MHGTANDARGASLGITTSNRAKRPESGFLALERYELQSVAAAVLAKQRVAGCLRFLRPGAVEVAVHHSVAEKRARYGNLCLCGNVWQCAVCSATISNARSRELAEALALWVPRGSVYMATYTVQHWARMAPKKLVSDMLAAFGRMREGDSYKRLRDAAGVRYVVRSLEATWSVQDGWHPHFHQLLFVEDRLSRAPIGAGIEDDEAANKAAPGSDAVGELLQVELSRLWARAAGHYGLSCSAERGVRVEAAYDRVGDYVAKFGHEPSRSSWGPEHEMTQWHRKHGRLAGDGDRHYTPFDLLRWLRDSGEREPAYQFRLYAGAFFGRRQLSWTPNMRRDLGMAPELDDQEIVEREGAEWELLAMVSLADWRVIRAKHLRAQLLEVAAAGDAGALAAWIARQVKVVQA